MTNPRGVANLSRAIACGLAATMLAAPGGAQDGRSATAAAQIRTGRLVGVFDFDTGRPVVGAKVLDMRTGWSAVTTSTGTLSLFFVDTAGSLIQIAKLGYEPQRFFAANSGTDTAGITVLLKANAQALPEVDIRARRARGPADTVRALELYGFYDRRATTGAPASAFVTSEKIERLSLLKDLGSVSGREICTTNLYINGVKVDPPTLRAPIPGGRGSRVVVAAPVRNSLDALLLPSEVLAVEMYRMSEVPAQFNPMRAGKCGATLVWTR
jgi:hypothetical protein